jgi:hypothetical protein
MINKITAALGALVLSIVFVLVIKPDSTGLTTVKSYPATVCPANLSDSTSTSVLPSSKTLVKQIPSKKNTLAKAKTSFYLSSNPLLVEGNSETSINVTRSKSSSLAMVVCSISSGDQWFVGGSGAVTSKSSLAIINSGLSTSIVDLIVYSSTSVSSVISVRILKNSSKRIYLDTLAPGENSLVIHAITRSGRVTTFLHDQRQRGLVALGGDFVSQGADPATRVVIPAVSNISRTSRAAGNSNQTLRILAPGKISANVRVILVSTDGTFAPLELDDIYVKAGKVKDISFKPVVNSRNFSLVLTSDRPIVAAVKSSGVFNGANEFAWSTAGHELRDVTIFFGGLRPDVVFQGKNFEVDVQWTDKKRKVYSTTVRSGNSDNLATWLPKSGVLSARFSTVNGKVYGGAIFKEKIGFSHLPLVAGAQLESSAVPSSDTKVITRE